MPGPFPTTGANVAPLDGESVPSFGMRLFCAAVDAAGLSRHLSHTRTRRPVGERRGGRNAQKTTRNSKSWRARETKRLRTAARVISRPDRPYKRASNILKLLRAVAVRATFEQVRITGASRLLAVGKRFQTVNATL